MDWKNICSCALISLIVLNIVPILLLGVSMSLIFDTHFYQYEFQRNGVYESFKDKALVNRLSSEVISYLSAANNSLPQIEMFTENENAHMLDVKRVINRLWQVLQFCALMVVISSILLLVLFRKYLQDKFPLILLWSGGLTLAFCLSLALLALNFEWAFTNFHYLFFPQGNWMFPRESVMLMLFPEGFFSDFFAAIIGRVSAISIILALIGVGARIKIRGVCRKARSGCRGKHGKA